VNETISSVLRDHADGDIHIERLLGAVHAGARRRRQRRLALTTGAMVVAAALVGVTGVVSTRQSAPVAGPVPDHGVPRPPTVERVPTLPGAPHILGSNPTLFHLDVADLAGLTYVSWSARGDGHEELAITTASRAEVLVEADRDPDRLRPLSGTTSATMVGDKPAQAAEVGGSQAIRWQPLPGIWAQVNAEALEPDIEVQAAIDIATKLKLDRAYRCAVPFRLDAVDSPDLRKCTTYYAVDEDTGRWVPAGGAWFTVGDDDTEYQVAVVDKADPRVVVNDTVDGRAIEVFGPTEIRYPHGGRTAYFWSFGTVRSAGTTRPEVLRSLAGAFRPVTEEDQRSWPSSPFS